MWVSLPAASSSSPSMEVITLRIFFSLSFIFCSLFYLILSLVLCCLYGFNVLAGVLSCKITDFLGSYWNSHWETCLCFCVRACLFLSAFIFLFLLFNVTYLWLCLCVCFVSCWCSFFVLECCWFRGDCAGFLHSREMCLLGIFMHFCGVFAFLLFSYILFREWIWFVDLFSVLLSLFCYPPLHINTYVNSLSRFFYAKLSYGKFIWLV